MTVFESRIYNYISDMGVHGGVAESREKGKRNRREEGAEKKCEKKEERRRREEGREKNSRMRREE